VVELYLKYKGDSMDTLTQKQESRGLEICLPYRCRDRLLSAEIVPLWMRIGMLIPINGIV